MRPPGRRPYLDRLGPAALICSMGGCSTSALPDPEAAVRCEPRSIEIILTNVGDRSAAYTVSVDIDRDGFTEREQYSSNAIAPGATATLTDDRPDDEETCKVASIEVFPG